MRLKQRVGDFRVRELLSRDYLAERGSYRVYRVTKRKLTSDEAARAVAQEAGVDASHVALAGLKDRQGITIQYMSVPGGREVRLALADLKVETIGFAQRPLSSADSEGNAFELTVRALRRSDVARLRTNVPLVREQGTINYFDEQRFGNLTHGQGWIYRDLCLGRYEDALRNLLAARSPRDDERHRRFKEGLERHWGDWRACRDVAGRFGAHHSIFEHLNRDPENFAGAFVHVATRLKLIHQYAWQSYLWNRAVVELVRESVPRPERVLSEGVDGPLIGYAGALPPALAARARFPLPGERFEGVAEADRPYFRTVLEQEGVPPEAMAVQGVAGFVLKPEERELVLVPRHLRIRPAEPDNLNPSFQAVRVRFELPRGGYATLVVKRLFALAFGEREEGGAFDSPQHEGNRDTEGTRGGAPRERSFPWRSREGEDRPRSDRPRDDRPRDDRWAGRPGDGDRRRPWRDSVERSETRRPGDGDPRGGGAAGSRDPRRGGDRGAWRGGGAPGADHGRDQGPGREHRPGGDRRPGGDPRGRDNAWRDPGSRGPGDRSHGDRRSGYRSAGEDRPRGGQGGDDRRGPWRPGGTPPRAGSDSRPGGGGGARGGSWSSGPKRPAGDGQCGGGRPGGGSFRGRDDSQGHPGRPDKRAGFGHRGRTSGSREERPPQGGGPQRGDRRDTGPEESER